MTSSADRSVAGIPLLETKLYSPRWRPGLVSRPRLIERLERGAERKLTLISAPAGFGKSTLLAEWLSATSARNRPVAWVSLDRGDNDPTVFWAYVVTAIQRIRPQVGTTTLARLSASPPPPSEAILTTLINEIIGIEDEFTLVLDDFHVIESPPVQSAIAFLVDHLPPRMHLVIASRAEPALPLARLRARGESSELRGADLRFDPAEAAAFLNDMMGLDLSTRDVSALETRTEGWIAGLQLAALSMKGRSEVDVAGFIKTFAGTHRYIVDYLVEEVLQSQPRDVRRFLLQTSILDRLSGPLCDAITGLEDGNGILDTLERSNLFVVPLDDTRQWYRYHQLFADVLRAHALAKHPDQVPEWRRRAAQWFEDRGMADDAIEQARAAGDHDTVARLLVANWGQFERLGRNASVARWSASLPEATIRTRPRLALLIAANTLATDNTNAMTRQLTGWAEEAINDLEERKGIHHSNDEDGTVVGPDGLDTLKGELLAMRIMHSFRSVSKEEIVATAGRALTLLPPSAHRVRARMHMVRAHAKTELHTLQFALPDIDEGIREARSDRNPVMLASLLSHRGSVYADLGRLDASLQSYEEALAAVKDVSAETVLEVTSIHTGFASVLLEQGDLAGSTAHIRQAIDHAARGPMRSTVLFARTTAADVMLTAGDVEAAFAHLEEAQAFVRGSRDKRFHGALASVEITLQCRIGDLDAAAEFVTARRLSPEIVVDTANDEEAAAYARYLILRGDVNVAARIVSQLLPIQRSRGRVRHEIRTLVLQAMALDRAGRRAHALDALGQATVLGEPGRFNQTFAAEGTVMIELMEALTDAVRSGSGPAVAGSLAYLTSLLRATRGRPTLSSVGSIDIGLREPLTDRETEILRLIVTGLRNQEIADRLFISLPTVKRHIANTYGKLGVDHRTEAIKRAHELNLL